MRSPSHRVVFFREVSGRVPVLDWLRELRARDEVAYAKCVARIQRLAEEGHQLRRPEADYLRDGVHDGQDIVVLAHALTKEAGVPHNDIERAARRRVEFLRNPMRYTHEENV